MIKVSRIINHDGCFRWTVKHLGVWGDVHVTKFHTNEVGRGAWIHGQGEVVPAAELNLNVHPSSRRALVIMEMEKLLDNPLFTPSQKLATLRSPM